LKAILLAAGRGSRLQPLTDVLPKCLMPILGVPLLEIWIEALTRLGVREVLVNTSYMADEVNRFLSLNERPVKFQITHETSLLGTAGTLFANRGFAASDDLMVIHADNFCAFPGRLFVETFERRPARAVATMMTFDTDSPHTRGLVKTDSRGMVQEMLESTPDHLCRRANGEVYIFSKRYMQELFSGPAVSDIRSGILPQLMGRMNEFFNSEYHRDIGSLDLYQTACRDVLARKDFGRDIVANIWPRFITIETRESWVQAWQRTGRKVQRCENILALEGALLASPDILLIDSMHSADLPALQKAMLANPGVSLVPWRMEA